MINNSLKVLEYFNSLNKKKTPENKFQTQEFCFLELVLLLYYSRDLFFTFICLCVCWCFTCVRMSGWPSGTVLRDSCELLQWGAVNWTLVLGKNSQCSYPLSHLSSPSSRNLSEWLAGSGWVIQQWLSPGRDTEGKVYNSCSVLRILMSWQFLLGGARVPENSRELLVFRLYWNPKK